MTDFELQQLVQELNLGPEGEAELKRASMNGALDLSEEQIAADMAVWLDDPVQYVRDVFETEPDEWQKDALRALVQNPRVAMKACKGPGKTAVLAWFGWWCVSLHAHCNGLALSITADNLRDNLWKELAVWYMRSAWLQREFGLTGDSLFHRESPKTWWLHARSFPKDADIDQQSNTLAGLHAQGFVFILLDEVSDMPDGVTAAAEGIFANQGEVEAHLGIAGNPTRCEGPLYNACEKSRGRWFVIEITGDPDDPKRSPRIDLDYARDAILAGGRDDPWVMTNILGKFPPTQSDKLLGPNDITAAEIRTCGALEYQGEAILYGLDVGRYGGDPSHLRRRQGPVLFRGTSYRGLDGLQLANRVSLRIREQAKKDGREPDAIFVDVGGVGASAFDQLSVLGWRDILVAVEFGSSADEPGKYREKRSEMWKRMAEWVKSIGNIPTRDAQLAAELMAPKYQYKLVQKRTVLCIETKDEMKKRGIPSPNEADALALTFYSKTMVPRHRQLEHHVAGAHRGLGTTPDWDPFEERA